MKNLESQLKRTAAAIVSAALILSSVPTAGVAAAFETPVEAAPMPLGGSVSGAIAPITLHAGQAFGALSAPAFVPSNPATPSAPASGAKSASAAAVLLAAPAELPSAAAVVSAPAAEPATATSASAEAASAPAQMPAPVAAVANTAAVRAAVDVAHPSAQGSALSKIYEGVGPRRADRAVFADAEGPVLHMNYQPAGMTARAQPRLDKSRTPVHILIGVGADLGREWTHDWNLAAVSRIAAAEIPGLQSLVIDSAAGRPANAQHFVEADLSDLSEANKASVAQRVVDYLDHHGLQAVGANALIQPNVVWGPVIQKAVQEANNPSILVNPFGAVAATVDKLATREIVGKSVESLRWPASSPGSIDDHDIEEKAVESFREISQRTPSGKVVLKLVTAAGKAGLRAAGIGTEEEMRRSVREVISELKGYWSKSELRDLYLGSEKNGAPRLLVEGLIDRLVEVDVELTASLLGDGSIDILGFIIGNPNPAELEKGYLLGMKGLLSPELQRQLVLSATEAVVAVWRDFGGLPFGNFHVEMILRGDAADPKPSLVEINATRPVGGRGVRLVREWSPEIDLIRAGARASLGLPQMPPQRQPADSMAALEITPAVTGTLVKAELPVSVLKASMADFDRGTNVSAGSGVFVNLAQPGAEVEGADGPHAGSLGVMTARGADALDAVKNSFKGLAEANYEIRKQDGKIHRQNARDPEHSLKDYMVLPQAPASAPAAPTASGLSPKAAAEMDKYEEAQLRWLPIFKVYYPLFSALMNAMGGLAAIGIGRIGYTMALFASMPFASVIASHLPVKKVLQYTWAGRVAIWSVLVPVALLAFPASAVAFTLPVLGWGVTSLQAALFGLNFLDGLMVSFSHTVDMDAGGMDEVAKQNGFHAEMTPAVRNHYISRFMAWSSKAQFIFPLAIALAVTAATCLALPIQWAFLAGMASTFLVMGGRALLSISRMNSNVTVTPSAHGTMKEFVGGLGLVWNDKKILGLVSLESLERSINDLLFMVAFPMLGLFAIQPALGLNPAGANLIATVLVSIMSFAGMKASLAAKKNWTAPEKGAAEHPSYKTLFPQMLIASAALLSIPASYALMTAGLPMLVGGALGLGIAALGAVGFMYAFKKAQIGAMNMFQTAAGAHEGSTRIYGISSAVSLLVSGFAVWAMESLFPAIKIGAAIPNALPAFLALSAFFLAVGAAYWLIWPRLASRVPAARKS